MLTLLCGRSGSGKTRTILKSIESDLRDGTPVLLLIPEQQVWSIEERMAELFPLSLTKNLLILSFSRLCGYIFEHCGGLTTPNADESVKTLLMWKCLRDLKDILRVYVPGKTFASGSLIPSLLDTTEDFRVNAIETDTLDKAVSLLPNQSPLREKLKDLTAVYSLFQEQMDDFSGGSSADPLLRAAEKLATHPLFAGYHVYLDSFTLLTAPEMKLLTAVVRASRHLCVSLCLDPGRTSPVFETAEATRNRLIRMADDLQIESVMVPLSVPSGTSIFSALEENLLDFSGQMQSLTLTKDEQASDTIRLIVAPHVYAEAEVCALHILELLDRGLKPDDIGIIVRDTSAWDGILDSLLEKYKIPFFMSERVGISTKPLVRLILSALRAVDSGWAAEDIITLAKTDLTGIRAQDIQLFCEYCEIWNIRGKTFLNQSWTMNPDGYSTDLTNRGKYILKTVNTVRKQLMSPLSVLHSDLKASADVFDMCRALCKYLQALHIPERLEESAHVEVKDGRARDAADTLRTGDVVLQLIDRVSRVIGDETMNLHEWISLLQLLFSQVDMGSVPQRRNCVMIGSASMLRTERVKALLILGMNEGEFPQMASPSGLVTEQDKILLEQIGCPIRTQQDRHSGDELFYLYRSITRPTEYLWISYHSETAEGTQAFPSFIFERLEKMIPDLSPIRFVSPPRAPAQDRMILQGGQIEQSLMEDTLRLTYSRLDSFVKCPYMYYCTYVLKLRESVPASIEMTDIGTFIHHVLEKIVSEFLADDRHTLRIPDSDIMHRQLDKIINDYLLKYAIPDRDGNKRLLHLFKRLRAIAVTMADRIREEMMNGSFIPAAFELSIGGRQPDALPPITYTLADLCRVCFTGKVDRVDVYTDGKTAWIRVIDYKTGNKTFSLDEAKQGTQMQLLLYLFSLCSDHRPGILGIDDDCEIRPAGAVYLSAGDGNEEITPRQSGVIVAEEKLLRAWNKDLNPAFLAGIKKDAQTNDFKGKACISEGDLKDLEGTLHDTFLNLAEQIHSGRYEKKPSPDNCKYCVIRRSCPQYIKDPNEKQGD